MDAARGTNSVPVPSLRLAQSLFALFASSLAISLVFAIIPLCHNVVVLAVVMAVAGLAMGCIDTISNMQLVKIYQKDSAIFLQVSVEPASPPQAVLPPPRKREELRARLCTEGRSHQLHLRASPLAGSSFLRGLRSAAEPSDR